MSAYASLDRTTVALVPGEEETVTIHVRNAGDVVEAYGFDVVGELAEWATVEPQRISLYPDTAGTATLVLKPPRSARMLAGELPFGVRVLPLENPQAAVVPEGTVSLLPFRELTGELLPRISRGRLRARHEVSVQNMGNVPATVELDAVDSGQQLRIKERPAVLEVAPGQTAYANLGIRFRRLLWRGTPHNHAFYARLTPSESPPQTLDGTCVQAPLLPRWLLRALAALLALLALLAALWFGLLRPTVRSAAREAADEQTQKVAEAAVAQQLATPAPPSGAQGGQRAPGAAGGSGAQPAPGAPPAGGPAGTGGGAGGVVSGPPSNDQFSTAISASTRAGGSVVRAFTVPQRKTFWMTDFVVQNPQGDEGLLSIRAGKAQVVRIALENFRDQDYHWVTPIKVPAGSKITMSVVCRKVGTPPSGPTPTTCSELLYLNGVIRSTP
jgi:hypothetical protein